MDILFVSLLPDGTMWYPFVKKTDTLYVFSSDICRSIYAQYDSSYKLKGVINVHRFVPAEGVFASAKKNPANAGFCTPKNNCLDSGVLNVSECKGMHCIYFSGFTLFRR